MYTCDSIDMQRLPTAIPDFTAIQMLNKIYVDKSDLIYQIASSSIPIFFSRPRRFGKTLLLNTLSSLFMHGLKYFHGLMIDNMWHDKTYKIVHIDFSRMALKNIFDLNYTLSTKIIKEFGENNDLVKSNSYKLQYPDIILDEILKNTSNNSIVLLIDEYDAPLTNNINEPAELKDILNVLSNFYATVKQYTAKFRHIFITGVTRTCHNAIFSSSNNILDLSLDATFNKILGFTKSELVRYFDPYVENAAHILEITKNDLYDRLEQYYDGFQFALNANETVYNPWSILNFLTLSHNGLQNYWFDSGGTPTIIMQYLKIEKDCDFLDYNKRNLSIEMHKLSHKYEINDIPRDILLYQTGYFSLRNKDDGYAHLVISNLEIEESLLLLYLEKNHLETSTMLNTKMKDLVSYIDSKNLSKIIAIFNTILNECVSILSKIFDDERSLRDIIYAALINVPKLQKIKESETVKGRADLELITKKTCMIIEFKRISKNLGPKLALTQAIKQIKENRYGERFSETHDLYRVVMIISTESKMIVPNFCQEVK